MLTNRLAFAGLALACVLAAAGGGYLATRHDAASKLAASAPASSIPGQTGVPAEAPSAATPPAAAETGARSALTPQGSRSRSEASVIRTPSRVVEPARPRSVAQPSVASAPSSVGSTDVDRPSLATATREQELATLAEVAELSTPSGPVQVSQASDDRPLTPAPAVEPQPVFEEIVVAADSVIGFQVDSTVSTETARVEDGVEARVVRDVKVGNLVAIPAGSRGLGSVTLVERGGRFKERARLGIRFHTLVLADGTRVPISTETIYRFGEAPGNASAAKIGGAAVGGAILGAILGGAKGAVVGATAGAGGGTAAVMAGDRNVATLPAGAEVTARVLSPITVTLEH